MLDGAARIQEVVGAAVADGQPAIGLTDHGVLYGAVDFYKAATSAGVKPILGVEAYLAHGSRFERPVQADNIRYHITLLAENQTGYGNLLKLVSRAYLEGYYYKPRMDLELLSEHADGIIATSGCLGGQVPRILNAETALSGTISDSPDGGRISSAASVAAEYQDIFGKDRFFVELHDHGLAAQKRILPNLLDVARRIDAPLLATNDVHYVRKEQSDAHDALLCIQTNSQIDDPNRLRFEGSEYFLKTSREMRTLFPDTEFPGACDNTLAIAERSNVQIEFGRLLLPTFPVPDGHTVLSHLSDLVTEGARHRYSGDIGGEVGERIQHEMRIVEEMGFAAYFLIVWDLVRYAKDHRIRVGPGRGSAAGSIIAYSLGITELDPLRYGLIFERFLNPGRRELPDIDIDFDERYRSDIIRYITERYGSDHVAQIVTFSTIKGKQAIRDSARVRGLPYALGDRLAKLMPPSVLGHDASLDACFVPPGPEARRLDKEWYGSAAALRKAYESDEGARPVIDTARKLEGLRRQDSIHAAAVVISPGPLTDMVPVQRKGHDSEVVTQFEMHAIEDLGLLKMDILGLRTLSVIDRALDLIEDKTGQPLDIETIPLDDPNTHSVLARGETIGVFQLEGTAMRSLIRSLKPDKFEDLIALVALYRPGPMSNDWHHAYADRKNGRKQVEYPHPATKSVLRETYGLMIYQEQVMQIARDIAGYTMADADTLRKAMGKKIPEIMRKERAKFVSGVVANGNPERFGRELFGSIEGFAGYGFNKSHSAAYALIAYQTAYLKAHHPAEYMAALLTSVHRDQDRTAIYLAECRSLGFDVANPSINDSDGAFTVRDSKILFGLSAVRNVGSAIIDRLVDERASGGPYADFYDFVNRVDVHLLNKRLVGSLIKAGAFDRQSHPRMGLFLAFEAIMDQTLSRRRQEDRGQFSLFDGGADDEVETLGLIAIPDQEWNKKTRLGFEKEMLGLYVSDHPLLGVQSAIWRSTTSTISDLRTLPHKSPVTVAGIVGGVNRRHTKGGQPMAFFSLEGIESSVEVLAFPNVMQAASTLIESDEILVVEGSLSNSSDELKLRASSISRLEMDQRGSELRLSLPAEDVTDSIVRDLRDILVRYPGSAPVYIKLGAGGKHKVLLLHDRFRVDLSSSLYSEICGLFGRQSLSN